MQKSPEMNGIPEEIDLPQSLSNLAYICIIFTEREGTAFGGCLFPAIAQLANLASLLCRQDRVPE